MLTGSLCIVGAAWFTLQLPKIRPAMRDAYREKEISDQRAAELPSRSVLGVTPLNAPVPAPRISTGSR